MANQKPRYEYKPAELAIVNKPGMDFGQLLAYMTQGAFSPDALGRWQADREASLSAQSSGGGKISFKVSRKGAVSVYGLQRMPVTLYAEQWERFLADGGKAVLDFINSNPTTHHDAKPANGKEPAEPAIDATIQRKTALKVAA